MILILANNKFDTSTNHKVRNTVKNEVTMNDDFDNDLINQWFFFYGKSYISIEILENLE